MGLIQKHLVTIQSIKILLTVFQELKLLICKKMKILLP